MPSIRKNLLQLIFSGSSMKRWNDKLRPMELYEIDKQAHKMMVAWLLLELGSRGLSPEAKTALGLRVIEGGLFDYLYRLVITDIKPPIFYQIKSNPDHYRRLTAWVLAQLTPRLQILGPEFLGRMQGFLDQESNDQAGSILRAAHLYASRYEFQLIRDFNHGDDELAEIEATFESQLDSYRHLPGMDQLLTPTSALGRFANLCGRLRFQTRWSQTPRIPETSVLGHLFLVAALAYFFSLELEACPARRSNAFFVGLFHDLPEVLTRDIISPVKRSVAGLTDLIREYELSALEHKVLSPLRSGADPALADRLAYYLGLTTGSEFDTVVRQQGVARQVSYAELAAQYNHDRYDPLDGGLVKICDNLAAFIEAYTALRNGISADQLQHSLHRIRQLYQADPLANGVQVGALLADFD